MKKVITILLIAISFTASAQTNKADSIKQVEVNKAVTQIITQTPIVTFQEWLYDKMSAKTYNEFLQYYNAFIQEKYNDKAKPKK